MHVANAADKLDLEALRDWYLARSDSHKLIFLSLVSNQLTIHGRAFCIDLTGSGQIKAFEGLNELQHQISGHITAIGLNHARYPDEVLWNILNEKAAAYGLLAHLYQSFYFARTRDCWKELG